MNMSEERRAHGTPDNLVIVAAGRRQHSFFFSVLLKMLLFFFFLSLPFLFVCLRHQAGREMKIEGDQRSALHTGVCG